MNSFENDIRKAYESYKVERKTIFIFEGFKYEYLEGLDNKFFDKNYKDIFEINLNYNSMYIFSCTNVALNSKNSKFWMTSEEYSAVESQGDFIKGLFSCIVVKNNIYNKFYPFDNTIKNIKEVYERFFYNVSDEIEKEYEESYEVVSKFYGDILYSKDTNRYYINHSIDYPSNFVIKNLYEDFDVIDNINENYTKNSEDLVIELSEDELVFLDFTGKILKGDIKNNRIAVVIMSNILELPNKYLERASLIQNLFQDKLNIFFARKKLNVCDPEKIKKYENLLNRYWGYEKFRDLDMYENIKSSNKSLIKISQGQIINDIVEQTETALLDDKDKEYRDIFITSSTGSGKSIMFQLPAIYLKEKHKDIKPLVIVISPLIALMEDQVDSLKEKDIDIARTINSNTDGYKRLEILEEINNGDCSILYISPENLQAKTNIKELIGDRRLSLVIIDEAHIVTTWGKSFRADYWYLGIYLQKLRKQYSFPIVTFTATAILGGKEDMYLETRDSLNMINPISYFGKIKRDDIFMVINSSDKDFDGYGREYKRTKQAITLKNMKLWNVRGEKALIYFPTVRDLNDFHSFIKQNDTEIFNLTGRYNGQLNKVERSNVLESFRDNKIKFVLATKAFGMGVDIPDINHVYHYNPSGTVIDYIQEIGRVARDHSLVKYGYAHCDFLKYDFTAVKRLQGMSRINKYELLAVMDKIKTLYENKGFHRNLLISTDDFKYIFAKSRDDSTDSDLDNKVKTALLLIEKDFSSPKKLGYSPFVARPRGVFGKDIILVNENSLKELNKSILKKYIKKEFSYKSNGYNMVYSLDLSKLWEDKFRKLSFPNFKRIIYTRDSEEIDSLTGGAIFKNLVYATIIQVDDFDKNNINDKLYYFNNCLDIFSTFLGSKKRKEIFFTSDDLSYFLRSNLKSINDMESKTIAQTLINACFDYQNLTSYTFISERINQTTAYKITQSYDVFIDFTKQQLKKLIFDNTDVIRKDKGFKKIYTRKNNGILNQKKDTIVLSIAENLNLLSYNIEKGNSPQLYMRINSISPLEKSIGQGEKYQNYILNDIYDKHRLNIAMLTYLFKHEADGDTRKEKVINYTKFFWEKIENYFLGETPEEVKQDYNKI